VLQKLLQKEDAAAQAQFVTTDYESGQWQEKIEKENLGEKQMEPVQSSTPATNTPSSWFASKSDDVPGKTQNERKPLLLRLQSAQTATAQQQQERTHNSLAHHYCLHHAHSFARFRPLDAGQLSPPPA
jgi:hypothetical protein